MTGSSFSIKLKSKNGQFIVKDLTATTTVSQIKQRIAEVMQIKESQLHVLAGYPPRPLDLSIAGADLATTGIKSGDTLIVEEKPAAMDQATIEADEALARRLQAEEENEQLRQLVTDATTNAHPKNVRLEPETVMPQSGPSGNFNGILLKKVVPADNSCLFSSIRYVLNDRATDEGSEFMRHIIAQEVSADPQVYNDAMLGKSNAEYCVWIQRPDSWGGAIEVAILSNYYGIEIDVVDVQNAIINRFGEDQNYGLRVFLLFDGIHYDPLYMETGPGAHPLTMFPIEEIGVYQLAEQLATEAKSSRQFTNVNNFSLRCMQCDIVLQGQAEAQEHARASGHNNFGEI